MSSTWPAALWLVRHGESAGNAAAVVAERSGAETVAIEPRDADVDLTQRGVDQALALGDYLAGLAGPQRPRRAVMSPYRRARRTGDLALRRCAADGEVTVAVDERLRDRELGVFDRLTYRGITARFPAEAEALRRVGKFYYRPPGGESWVDVSLRLRGVLDTLRADYAGERVIIFAHDIVVLLFRYLLEGLDEAALMDLQRRNPILNCGVTVYQAQEGKGLVLTQFNATVDGNGSIGGPVRG